MSISEELNYLGLLSGEKTSAIFDSLYRDILTVTYTSESALVNELWGRYTPVNKSLNGNVFEAILATIFYRSGILPLYVQAKLSFVPNISFDFVAYSKEFGPVILSAKTSLRERYKQADLEGMMVRQVHRRSKSYLITLSEKEALPVNEKIEDGSVLGIDDAIVATDTQFDVLISDLKSLTYYEPEKIDVLTGLRIISS